MPTVSFITLRSGPEKNLLQKLDTTVEQKCNPDLVKKGEMVALKTHFGERGNLSFVRHQFIHQIVEIIKRRGGKPFLTDTNTLYIGTRSCAPDHIMTAFYNGFGPLTTGAPVIIGDGLRGESKVKVEVNGEYVKEAVIGEEVFNADAMIAVSHFKGHELTGFGGAIKNLGMGCAAREGKLFQHSTVSPYVVPAGCIACGRCVAVCPVSAITIAADSAKIDPAICIGCADCIVICPEKTIEANWNEAMESVMRKMAEYARGAVMGKEEKTMYINFITQVSPLCDCYGFNDVPVAPDLGICVSTDPVAIDQACMDLIIESQRGIDPFKSVHPHVDWQIQLEQGEKIGLGSRKYDLETID